MREELLQALEDTDNSVDAILARPQEFLSIRERLIPHGEAVLDVRTRDCLGGPVCLFAVARPRPHNDFALVLQIRSGIVTDGPGRLSVVPQCIHQPVFDASADTVIGETCIRELAEEVFGGSAFDEAIPSSIYDWYRSETAPMRWLCTHGDDLINECTCVGFEPFCGAYNIGTLFAVMNPNFYNEHEESIKKSWETEKFEIISTNDATKLSETIHRRDWAVEGFQPFVEGLLRLRDLRPSSVAL